MRRYSEMKLTISLAASLCAAIACTTHSGIANAQTGKTQVPPAEIAALQQALAAPGNESSAARQRLATKRIVRDCDKLIDAHPTAPNRFEVLSILFDAQKRLFAMDDSSRNRAAILETGKELMKAPDEYAALRLDADLLITQTEAARKGADPGARLAALLPMVARYEGTPGEAKMLRVAMVMALETGDPKVIKNLRRQMAVRFAGDTEMINFQRDKLGGQVFGAPFCGSFKRTDGTVMQLPADVLGKTTILYFWSQEDPTSDHLQRLAAAWQEKRSEVGDRLQIVSFNVDELPDAGEKTLRDLGVEWPALHLPGGRNNALYKTFPKRDPYMMTMSPTGYVALIMSGATRKRASDNGKTDFDRWFQSSLARDWSRPRYITQLNSIFAGDFLVVDPQDPFDPALPPEIKALSIDPKPLARTSASVPEETLRAIQACLPAPPIRYRMSAQEIRSAYERSDQLCAKAIADHPAAPDLWIVRNRRIIAQLGLWKLTSDQKHYLQAVEQAKAALAAEMPTGTDVAARFCLAKEALRIPAADGQQIITDFVKSMGGENASGPTLAAAAMLALDIADRGLNEEYRQRILEKHATQPMMWTFVSFLLDREHQYWLFRVPFTAGWSYGRQHQWLLSRGYPDAVERHIDAELVTLDGKPYRLPEDSLGKWTIVLFTGNWLKQEKSPMPSVVTRYLNPYLEKRGRDDVQVIVAVLDEEVADLEASLKETPLNCETMLVPGGLTNPLTRQWNVVDEDQQPSALVLRPDGKIAIAMSGLTMSRAKPELIMNLIDRQDEQTVIDLLERGETEKAAEFIFQVAPPFDPEAVDEKGRKLKEPVFNYVHLRARARVYAAMNNWNAALADAEEAVKFLTAKGGWMSMRPDDLDQAETLLADIRKMQNAATQ
ncbi:MAG: hypothetical protein P8L85_10995 [Rubripirellula sp.]|nr:hypothetical protein [Rubripirellula sp.]